MRKKTSPTEAPEQPALDAAQYRLPRYREIPDVGLLLEQTARLINGYLEPLGSVRLTNSMISNYVKQRIIPRPVRKLYYREQIAALIFIALSKTALSLEDTAKLLQLQNAAHPAETAYNYFCEHFEEELRGRFAAARTEDSDADLLSCLITTVVDGIHLQKRLTARNLR